MWCLVGLWCIKAMLTHLTSEFNTEEALSDSYLVEAKLSRGYNDSKCDTRKIYLNPNLSNNVTPPCLGNHSITTLGSLVSQCALNNSTAIGLVNHSLLQEM